jgi:hypothetical protein
MADHKSTMKELARWVARRPKSRHIYVVKGATAQEVSDRAAQLAAWAVEYGIEKHVILEMGNEVNLGGEWRDRPEDLGELVAEIWGRIEPTGIKVLSPSISNIGPAELEYAAKMLGKIPAAVGFAFHRYTTPDLSKPRSGYLSRVAEVEAVKNVAGAGRELWMTETGQSEVYYRSQPWPYCWRQDRRELSEDEIARQMINDLRFWYETELIEGVSYYQLNDGPDPNNTGHRYGWRDLEDTYKDEWKLVARLMGPEIAVVDEAGPVSPVAAVRRVEAKHRWFHEPEKPVRNSIPLGNSLFHALGGMPRDYYETVIDNLAGLVNDARFNISTLGWGKLGPETQTAPAVIPFKKGGAPDYWGYSRKVDPKFLDEMEVRLAYAVSRGIRPQLTVFWGAFQEMFIDKEAGSDTTFHNDAIEDFLRAVCQRLKDHPAVNVELFNEINHGSHLALIGRKNRAKFIDKWGRFIKEILPDVLLSVSGENIDHQGKEGGYNFAYHGEEVLDYWNVHVNRDKNPAVEGFPPWVRTCWHLNDQAFAFVAGGNRGQGFGRNDEPIFLQTEKQHKEWPYGGSSRDWQMYGMSIFVALCAGVGTTIHNQGGFFLGYNKKRPNRPDPDFPQTEPIYKVAAFYQKITKTFPFAGCTPFNSGWKGSPVRSLSGTGGGSFKAFCLAGQDDKEIIVTVLKPEGNIGFALGAKSYRIDAYEVDGALISSGTVGPGEVSWKLPKPQWKYGCILHLTQI